MKKYGKIILTFLLLLLLPLLLIKGSAAAQGVRQGLELAYHSILPALFPAMVLCGMIGELAEHLPLPVGWTFWLTSHLCGFPLGIRTLVRGYHRGLLTREQTLKLSACCANASPAFLIIYIGKTVLGSIKAGILLFLGQLMISFTAGMINGSFKKSLTLPPQDQPLLTVAANSVATAALGSLTLTGYITFFAVVAALCRDLPYFCYYYGFLELTGGLTVLPPVKGQILLAAAMSGFSGFSVLLQNAAYLAEAQLPTKQLILGKAIYAVGLPFAVCGLSRWPATFFAILTVFLICFDKWRKRQYNIKNEKVEQNGELHDLCQRC